MTPEELSVLNNLMCNISAAYQAKDWEMILQAYCTAQGERKQLGLPPFVGGPNLEEGIVDHNAKQKGEK